MMVGSVPTRAVAKTLARGFKFCSFTAFSEASKTRALHRQYLMSYQHDEHDLLFVLLDIFAGQQHQSPFAPSFQNLG